MLLLPKLMSALLALAFALGIAPEGLAQAIRGHVVSTVDSQPIVDALVQLKELDGTVIAQQHSDLRGRYAFPAVPAGSYLLGTVRIGYHPLEISVQQLLPGESREVDLVLREWPLELPEVGTSASGQCRMRPTDRDFFLDLWERARRALGPHVSQLEDLVLARILEVDGSEDGPLTLPDGTRVWNANRRYTRIDSLGAREAWTSQFVARSPPDRLVGLGFARVTEAGEIDYELPHPQAVLSDDFLAHYCFEVETRGTARDGRAGIRFDPIASIDSRTEIRGIVWLDIETATVRQIDFEFINLPRVPFADCRSMNRPLQTPRGQRRYGPYCFEPHGGAWVPRPPEGTGGTLEFTILENGAWFASDWNLRMRGEEFVDRPAGFQLRTQNRMAVRCFDRDPACAPVYVAVPRLRLTYASVAELVAGDEHVYVNQASLAALERIASAQAQSSVGHVAGFVHDARGHPIRGAVLTTELPTRAAMSDQAGRFELRTLPAKELAFSVTRPGFQSLRFRLPVLADSTRQLTITLVADPSGGPRE